jgi:hypothetical protein
MAIGVLLDTIGEINLMSLKTKKAIKGSYELFQHQY